MLFAVGTTAAAKKAEGTAVCGRVVNHSGYEPNA